MEFRLELVISQFQTSEFNDDQPYLISSKDFYSVLKECQFPWLFHRMKKKIGLDSFKKNSEKLDQLLLD